MSPKKQKELSKHLSYVLRHKPEAIGIELDKNGWTPIADLIAKSPKPLSPEKLKFIVENNDKKRFVISEDGTQIRANQGHSVTVDLALTPTSPPDVLFHGTATRFLPAIFQDGLQKMKRQHVHLSRDLDTAAKVGRRHGKLVTLAVDAAAMETAGYSFFLSENGVWLTDMVPAEFLSQR